MPYMKDAVTASLCRFPMYSVQELPLRGTALKDHISRNVCYSALFSPSDTDGNPPGKTRESITNQMETGTGKIPAVHAHFTTKQLEAGGHPRPCGLDKTTLASLTCGKLLEILLLPHRLHVSFYELLNASFVHTMFRCDLQAALLGGMAILDRQVQMHSPDRKVSS